MWTSLKSCESEPSHAIADVDFCVTLGGDGTVLHLTSLFSEDTPLPPLVSFAMGTLGFLTPFDVTEYASCLTQVLDAAEKPVFCTLRTRKRCELTGCAPHEHLTRTLVGFHDTSYIFFVSWRMPCA